MQPIIEPLLGSVLNDLNGTPAKLETQLDLAALSGLEIFGNAEPLGVLAAPVPGPFPVSDRGGLGMELSLNGGAEGALADCVEDPGPFEMTAGPLPEPPATDSQNRPYHLWATFSSAYLNQVLYAAHRSGALCLSLSSEDIRDLTGGTFSLNASLLSLLASDLTQIAADRAPVIVELKPSQPAKVQLGSGTEDDWLLNLDLQGLGIAFHILIQDRYVRVFEVTANAAVGLNLTVLPDNRLEVAVGDIAIQDFEETFNEILPNANFAEVLPSLLDVVLGAILNQAITFDINLTDAVSDALNVPVGLRVNDILRDGPDEDYITMMLTLTATAGFSSLENAQVADTRAWLHEDAGLIEPFEGRMRPTGRAQLIVREDQRGLEDVVFQARVDGGLWRVARSAAPDGTLEVDDPKLKLPGRHWIEVRARYLDDYTSLDPSPVGVEVTVDIEPPKVQAQWGDSGVDVTVFDESAGLKLEARLDNGAWTAVPNLDEAARPAEFLIPYGEILGHETLELVASDGTGNQSRPVRLRVPSSSAQRPEASASASESSYGCRAVKSVPQNASRSPWVFLAILVGTLAYRVRKRC